MIHGRSAARPQAVRREVLRFVALRDRRPPEQLLDAWRAMVSGRRCQDHDQRAAIPEAASQDNPKEVIRMYGEWMKGMNEVQEQLLDFKLKEKMKKAENRMKIKLLEDPPPEDPPPASQQPPASQRRTPPEYVPLAPTDHPTRGGWKL